MALVLNLLFVNVIYTVTKPGFSADACHPVWVSGIFFLHVLVLVLKRGEPQAWNGPAARSSAEGFGSVTCAGEEVQIVLIHRSNAAESESELKPEPAVLGRSAEWKTSSTCLLGFLAPRLWSRPAEPHVR